MNQAISPGVYRSITDLSGYTPENSNAGFNGAFPVFSRRGEDNTIKFKGSDLTAIAEYGEPLYSKYGLDYTLAIRWLKGGSAAQICRLLPDDATFSNLVLSLVDKTVTTPDASFMGIILDAGTYATNAIGTKNSKFYIQTSITAVTGFTDDWDVIEDEFISSNSYTTGDFVVNGSSLYKAAVDVAVNDGWDVADWAFIGKVHTLADTSTVQTSSIKTLTSVANIDALLETSANGEFAVIRAIGRGSDYNTLGATIKQNEALLDTYDFAMYDVQFFDVDSNGFKVTIENQYTVSFDKDAMDVSGESLFFEDVINKYSSALRVHINSDVLEDMLVPKAQEFIDESITIYDVFNTDFLGSALETEVALQNGSEGSLVDSKGRVVQSIKNDLVIDFFSGAIDSRILNFKEIPIKIVADANYPKHVKDVVNTFTQVVRTDVYALFSTGFQANETQELLARSGELTYDNRNAGIYANNYTVYDSYSGKFIKVPSIYDVVFNVSNVFKVQGVHIAVAGYRPEGTIPAPKSGSLAYNPSVNYTDQFYLKQINPVLKDSSGTYIMGTLTTQKKATALQQMPIVNTLQTMDIELAIFTQSYLFSQLTGEVMDDIRNKINDYFVKWYNNRAIESVDVNVYASALDKKNKQVRVDIELVFTSFVEKLLINFIVK